MLSDRDRFDRWGDHLLCAACRKEVIFTLLITILVEGCVVFIFCAVQKRPAGRLLLASFMVNVLTQVLLWVALKVFFQNYLITLIVVEVLIWLLEGVFLHRLPGNNLNLRQALTLSLCMNAASFGIGWFLPV